MVSKNPQAFLQNFFLKNTLLDWLFSKYITYARVYFHWYTRYVRGFNLRITVADTTDQASERESLCFFHFSAAVSISRRVGRYIPLDGVATGITTGWRLHTLSPLVVYFRIYTHTSAVFIRTIFSQMSFLFYYRDAFTRIYSRHLLSSTRAAMIVRIRRLPRVPLILL